MDKRCVELINKFSLNITDRFFERSQSLMDTTEKTPNKKEKKSVDILFEILNIDEFFHEKNCNTEKRE